MARFGQVITAMVTPFKDDGSLDLDGARNLAKWLEANGNDGLVIAQDPSAGVQIAPGGRILLKVGKAATPATTTTIPCTTG